MARHAEESQDDLQGIKTVNVFYQVVCMLHFGLMYILSYLILSYILSSLILESLLLAQLLSLMRSPSRCVNVLMETDVMVWNSLVL